MRARELSFNLLGANCRVDRARFQDFLQLNHFWEEIRSHFRMILLGDTFKLMISFINNIYNNHADVREFRNVRLNGIKFRDIRFASVNIFENAILRIVYSACRVEPPPHSFSSAIAWSSFVRRTAKWHPRVTRPGWQMSRELCGKSFQKFCSNIWMLHAWMFRLSLRRAINIYAIIIYKPRSRFYSSSNEIQSNLDDKKSSRTTTFLSVTRYYQCVGYDLVW